MALASWLMTLRRRRGYLDYASAPPVLKEARCAVEAASTLHGNPGAIHTEGVEAAQALEDARTRIAAYIGVKAREIIFTSGLTESNNLAILGLARALERKKRTLTETHWIVSSIEHVSVLDCFAEVERLGGAVSHVEPDERGRITPEAVGALLRKETVLVSIGWGNNEIGYVQPLKEIRRVLDGHEKSRGTTVLFHSDAGQGPLYFANTAHSLGVDLLALGANKLHGPHGVGALFIHNRAELAGVLQGGLQERGLRAGTENVALAAGFAAAYEIIALRRETESKRLRSLRDELAKNLMQAIPGLVVNGDLKHALPHMLNISLPNIQSEYITLALDHAGIAVSTKSACREGQERRSHVVLALGDAKSASSSVVLTKEERAENTLRFSLGDETKEGDIKRIVEALVSLVDKK